MGSKSLSCVHSSRLQRRRSEDPRAFKEPACSDQVVSPSICWKWATYVLPGTKQYIVCCHNSEIKIVRLVLVQRPLNFFSITNYVQKRQMQLQLHLNLLNFEWLVFLFTHFFFSHTLLLLSFSTFHTTITLKARYSSTSADFTFESPRSACSALFPVKKNQCRLIYCVKIYGCRKPKRDEIACKGTHPVTCQVFVKKEAERVRKAAVKVGECKWGCTISCTTVVQICSRVLVNTRIHPFNLN